jgi:hypothetical protein
VIGLDFPVKPQWIHDVHTLWQPEQPVGDLVQAAITQTMQELGGEKTRRNSLTVILRYFVKTEGGGQSRRTAARDVWVAYSRHYPTSTLAPAYLAYLVAQNEVAQHATRFITQRYAPGDRLVSSELRRHTIAQFGERKVVTNAANAFLRTLLYFGVLEDAGKLGHYRFLRPLPVSHEVFPLIVWAWWQHHLDPQIDLSDFTEDTALAFLQFRPGHLASYWQAYQPALWVLEERIEGRRATLKHADVEGFERALLELVENPEHLSSRG